MREKIDYETGEVITVEDENEIAERKLIDAGAITEETSEFIEQYLTMKQQWDIFRYVLEKAMRENGIKSWKNEQFSATVKDETTRTTFDTKAFAEDNPELYAKYQKVSVVKPSLMIKFKGE